MILKITSTSPRGNELTIGATLQNMGKCQSKQVYRFWAYWTNMSSGIGLFPDSAKSLPERILTYHQDQFHRK